jgi:hypothetical protein
MRQALLLLLLTTALMAADQSPTVGREGAMSVVLANPLLQPVPVDTRAKLMLRIANRVPEANGTRYDLRWIGAVPGTYDLTRYLVDADGRQLSGVAPVIVTVQSLLPPGFPGDIITRDLPAGTRIGGYQLMMIGMGIVWLIMAPFLWRRQRRAKVVVVPVAVLSLAEQLRNIIERAQSTGLDTDSQARLERLLLAHWRERLGLQHLDAPAAMQQLRQHAEAGALLRQLDFWLHAPPGREAVDVLALLAPYRETHAMTSTVRP